ncbi:hypothetical protein [Nocardia sp. CDC160]|uniref:hypothetical protein n=1 Tax=Nocardia sp. CDC160 TaxID=3112166 RepID=UPI002DB762C3|nr:hypothetical protein [Nocardia sp. CDC160]MEC3919243.1 hypothetical protein [Nocardia sp. CDC160]
MFDDRIVVQSVGGLFPMRKSERLTATSFCVDNRISVSVDGDGDLIEVSFSSDVDDVEVADVARAVAAAALNAAAYARRAREFGEEG